MDEYINVSQGLERLRGNEKIYHMLLQKFLDDTHYGALSKALEAGDNEAATREAHTIKGVAANLSMDKLQQAALALEAELRAGNHQAATLEALEQTLNKTVESVKAVLAK